MMKNFVLGSVLVLTLALANLGSLYAQEPQQTQPSPDTPQAGQSSERQPASQVQSEREFTGTVVKEGKSVRLKDTAGNANYKLDHQSKAQEYAGKQVRVKGKLDTATNIIQVSSISAMQ
jgi:Protein of unknown function (DUF5818)